MDNVISWLVRWVHVTSAVIWIGTLAFLAMVLLPRMARGEINDTLRGITAGSIRVLAGAAAATFIAGLVLIGRSRGFENVGRGEWGGILALAVILTIGLAAYGATSLRVLSNPSALNAETTRRAARVSLIASLVGFLILALMTRLPYAA